jgi:hypothetical protein
LPRPVPAVLQRKRTSGSRSARGPAFDDLRAGLKEEGTTVGRVAPPSPFRSMRRHIDDNQRLPRAAGVLAALALCVGAAGCGAAETNNSNHAERHEGTVSSGAATGPATATPKGAQVARPATSIPHRSPKRSKSAGKQTGARRPKPTAVPSAFYCFRHPSDAARCAHPTHASSPPPAGAVTSCFPGGARSKACHPSAHGGTRPQRSAFNCFTSKAELARCRASSRER